MGSQWKLINSNYKNMDGYKRVAWPPVSEERIVREFTPQPQASSSALQGAEPQVAIYNNVKTQGIAQQQAQQHHQHHQHYQQQQQLYQQYNYHQEQPQQQQQNQYPHSQLQYQHANNPPKIISSQDINSCIHESFKQEPQQHLQQQQQPIQYTQAQHNRYSTPRRILQENVIPATPPISHLQQQQQYSEQKQQERAASCEYQQQAHVDRSAKNGSSGWKPIQPPLAKHQKQYQAQASLALASSNSRQQQYRASSYDNYQEQQEPQQPQYRAEVPASTPYNQHQAYQQTPYQPAVGAKQQPQVQAGWTQPQEQPSPLVNYQQQQQQQQQVPITYQQQPSVYNQQPVYSQQNQSQLYQRKQARQYPFSIENQSNQVPYNSNSQFQQHNQPRATSLSRDQLDHQAINKAQSVPQDYRGGSPGIIALRKEAPVSQIPAAIYSSQPAAIGLQGGSNMRGDLKWPPSEYKVAAQLENEERRKLALGPVCRPRKVHRDFTSFFEKNALNSYYPSYKVPPGTQHMLA